MDKKIIIKEVSLIHFLLLTTGKLMIGIGIGLMIASHYWYVQPYWFLVLILGLVILIPLLYRLMRAESKEEISLIKKIKKR